MEEIQGGSGPSKCLKQFRDESHGGEYRGSSPRAQGVEDTSSKPSRLEKGHCCLLPNCASIAEDCFTVTFPGEYTDNQGHRSDVAVKVPKANLGEVSLKAVRNELRVLSHLQEQDDHENVIHCLGGNICGTDGWNLEGLDHIQVEGQKDCVVLERGVNTLHQWLYENKDFSNACTYRKLIKIFADVARGLEHVHQSNMVHCNLSLANVMINDKGRAKLAGFHASVRRPKKHIPWQLCGTFGYIAPELFCAIHNGKRLKICDNIDTFGLGVMMLECLTRLHPLAVQERNYPELWKLVCGCCENYVHGSGKYGTSISTDDTIVRESLCKVLDDGSLAKLLPWPDAFWRLLDKEDGVEERERSLQDANEVVKKLRHYARNQSRSAIDPWPPELCLLIAECVSFVVEEGKCSVKRPSACQIAASLEAMCHDECPWLDNLLPWTNVVRKRVALSQEMDVGSCRLDYPQEKLGEGAVGIVLKGLYKDDEGLPHDVAVKLVTKYKDTIQKELKVFEKLCEGHPNVVQCFGGSVGDGEWDMEHMKHIEISDKQDFMVLEYLPTDLHQLLYENKSFASSCTYKMLINLFIDMARGLQFLHEHKIVHFDLKPRNILVDNWQMAKVTDLSESRIRVKDSITKCFHGTIAYIAPELLPSVAGNDARVCDNIDIFSLGVIMRECLTRKGPVELAHCWGKRSTGMSEETTFDLQAEAPGLWAVVRDCRNEDKRNEQNFVERPTPAAVVNRLGAMLKASWARKFVPWVPCGSCVVFSVPKEPQYWDWPFHVGLYKDNDGLLHNVAIRFFRKLDGEQVRNELQGFEKLGNGHPNVVKCYGGNVSDFDWGMSNMNMIERGGEGNFLVLEFLPQDLSQLLYTDHVFQTNCTYKKLIDLFIDIARGLQFLHDNGVVHGKLTTTAVRIDEHGRAKIAHPCESKIGIKIRGTTRSFGPVPCRTHHFGVGEAYENDIISLGGIMHECLTRKWPKEVAHERGRPTRSVEVGSKIESEAPELWALVCDCHNHEKREGQNFVERPTPAVVVERLEAMLNLPWAGLVPWGQPGSCALDLRRKFRIDDYCFLYMGVYIDNHGEAQNVVIKVADVQEDAISSLKNELQVFEKLGNGHPNVVKCYGGNVSDFDWGMSNMNMIERGGEGNFLVLEFLPQALSQLLYANHVSRTSCTYKKLIELFIDIARGLQFLHENGVVHGNLTTTAVRIDQHGRAKLTFIGDTRIEAMDSSSHLVSTRLGCAAPELHDSILSSSVERSKNGDIFSLGGIMLKCLGVKDTLGQKLKVPTKLEDLIARCCSMEVNDNGCTIGPTAVEVVSELEAMLSEPWVDDLIPLTSLSPVERLKWRRNYFH